MTESTRPVETYHLTLWVAPPNLQLVINGSTNERVSALRQSKDPLHHLQSKSSRTGTTCRRGMRSHSLSCFPHPQRLRLSHQLDPSTPLKNIIIITNNMPLSIPPRQAPCQDSSSGKTAMKLFRLVDTATKRGNSSRIIC